MGAGDFCPLISPSTQDCESSSLITLLYQNSKILTSSGRINTLACGLLSTTVPLAEIGVLRLSILF